MRNRRFAAVLLLVTVGTAGQVATQGTIGGGRAGTASQAPPLLSRDLTVGTARIRGRVLNGDSGQPLPRAEVQLTGSGFRGDFALTDERGAFEFRGLPAGRCSITSAKPGFLTVSYGQTRPFEAGKPIDLHDGEVIEKLEITMPRAAAIAGRIVDEFGGPVTDVVVSALRSTWSGGRRRLTVMGRSGLTNDLGEYRLFGLAPGEYIVRGLLGGTQPVQLEMTMAMVAGRSAQASTPASGYAASYYPGTSTAAEAQRVTVGLGQDLPNIDFAVIPVRLAKISGVVTRADGRPATTARVSLVPRNPDTAAPVFSLGHSAVTDAHGAFAIGGVPPGNYLLQTDGLQVRSNGEGLMVFTTRSDGGAELEVGAVPVTVAGKDVLNVVVVTATAGTATGSVLFEDQPAPESFRGMRVMAHEFAETDTAIPTRSAALVSPDGTFLLQRLSGSRFIRVSNAPTGWMLKSVRIDGRDITDSGMTFNPGDVATGLQVVLTNKPTAVFGTATDADGAPKREYTVLLFSQDEELWTVPYTRWVAVARPDQTGRFEIRNVPAGAYYVVGVEYIERGSWEDPDVLRGLKAVASKCSVKEGQSQSLTVTVRQ